MMTPQNLTASLSSSLPDITSPMAFKGLNAEVELVRDSHRIPHVKARSAADAFFGQGFATAQDRLWHMDYDRHRAYGRWAEFAGQIGVEQDLLMRRFQIEPSAQGDYRAVNPKTRAMLDAYAAGVNAFIESSESLPVEYGLVDQTPELWRPWDCMAVFKVRHVMMGSFEAKLWRARLVNELGPKRTAALFPGYETGQLLIVPPGAQYDGAVSDGIAELTRGATAANLLKELDAGSNNWALAGHRTASGKPLMAGDPHRGLDTPNVYYQNHIACPEFDAVGLSFPGCPGFPHFGHNAHVAWCVTHAMADYQDLYIERFDRDDPIRYEFQGEWKRAKTRQETIKVRGGKSIELEAASTHHGPIIAGDRASGYAISLKYTATAEPNPTAEAILDMLTVASGDELDESMRTWVDPCNNFVYADVHGIGYLNRGRVPVRSMANAWLPVPGWTGAHEWEGYIPFEELVRSRNPASGYIVTANNRIASNDYPYYISLDFAPDYRARRITDRLNNIQTATVADMARVHSDITSIPALTYTELISQSSPTDDLSASAKELLARWDGSMKPDEAAPAIYSAFRDALNRTLLKHLLGDLADDALDDTGRGAARHGARLAAMFVHMASEDDAAFLPPGTGWSSLISRSLADAVGFLKSRLGPDIDAWQWGKVHFTRPSHTLSMTFPHLAAVLDPPSMPVGGDGDTPQAAGYSASDRFVVTSTSVARYVFDTSDWDNSGWIVPLGASGHPGSPHSTDQASLWADLKLIPMLYSWDRIAASAEPPQVLRPR